MNILVTGANGQLGNEMRCIAATSLNNYIFTDVAELDITDLDAIRNMIHLDNIKVIVNCAAYTNVDKAEDDYDMADLLNNKAVENLAIAAKEVNATLIHISTDYVFQGDKNMPCGEDCETNPLGIYGKTKRAGEQSIQRVGCNYLIFRTAWLYSQFGKNFVKTMRQLTADKDKLRVVFDQIGTPTYTLDLSVLLVDMIETEKYGYYHATNEGGYISWYDFTVEIFRQAVEMGHTEYSTDRLTVAPVTTAEYGISKAARPFNSRLDKSKLVEAGFTPLPTWQDALARYLKEIEF